MFRSTGSAVAICAYCKSTLVRHDLDLENVGRSKNPADPRNWAGGGRRSIANMFIDLGYSVTMTEEQFQAEMAKRREKMTNRNQYDIGCPLCWAPPVRAQPSPQYAAAGRKPGVTRLRFLAPVEASARQARVRFLAPVEASARQARVRCLSFLEASARASPRSFPGPASGSFGEASARLLA